MPPEKSKAVVGKVLAPKPYDLLAERLRESILGGEIAEGEALPSERELVEQTGLTRGAVREALKTLASEGLVQTRPGRFGGNVVTLPGRDQIATSLHQFVRGKRLPQRTLQETREVLEPSLAGLAAAHRTDADLAALTELHERLVDAATFPQFSRINLEWHQAVATAAGNELLGAVLEAISFGLTVSTTIEEYDDPDIRGQVIRIHERIMAAIVAGDAVAAERRMREHIGAAHATVLTPGTTSVPMSSEE